MYLHDTLSLFSVTGNKTRLTSRSVFHVVHLQLLLSWNLTDENLQRITKAWLHTDLKLLLPFVKTGFSSGAGIPILINFSISYLAYEEAYLYKFEKDINPEELQEC